MDNKFTKYLNDASFKEHGVLFAKCHKCDKRAVTLIKENSLYTTRCAKCCGYEGDFFSFIKNECDRYNPQDYIDGCSDAYYFPELVKDYSWTKFCKYCAACCLISSFNHEHQKTKLDNMTTIALSELEQFYAYE